MERCVVSWLPDEEAGGGGVENEPSGFAGSSVIVEHSDCTPYCRIYACVTGPILPTQYACCRPGSAQQQGKDIIYDKVLIRLRDCRA